MEDHSHQSYDVFVNQGSVYFRSQFPRNKKLKVYEMFPEMVLDSWGPKGSMVQKNVYQYDSGKEPNDGMYSDRMWQWDDEKMKRVCAEHMGGKSSWVTDPIATNKMLNAYLGHEVTLTQVIRMQDGRGFDLWYYAFIKNS